MVFKHHNPSSPFDKETRRNIAKTLNNLTTICQKLSAHSFANISRDTMKHFGLASRHSLTLEGVMIQPKLQHASFSSLFTHETMAEEEASGVSNNGLASSKAKPKQKVQFGYVRATCGTDPPGELSFLTACDCEILRSVDEIERGRESRKLHKNSLRLLRTTKRQLTQREKMRRNTPLHPSPTETISQPALPRFLVVKAKEDGSPDLCSRNSQCNHIKHNHIRFSTSATRPIKSVDKSKTNFSLPARLQQSDPMACQKGVVKQGNRHSSSFPGYL
jgi:hypothetical protein